MIVERKGRPQVAGIAVKKQFGQHFLREQQVVDTMIRAVTLTPETSVFEIGCGDGFLTSTILQHTIARLWVFEIDPEWAAYVRQEYPDERLEMFQENILDVDLNTRLAEHGPWVLLANIPYQITFPLLHLFQRSRAVLREGVIMIQDEVATKLLKQSGRDYGYSSLFFQYYFEMKSLLVIPPGAFYPPPKVNSRLLYFKPKKDLVPIPQEELFWRFIKICFAQPRRTLRNNLAQNHYGDLLKDGTEWDELRAQQMKFSDLLLLWNLVIQRQSEAQK